MSADADIERCVPQDGVVLVRVTGDVDLGAGSRLARELAAAQQGGEHVVVDLAACTFLDSSGLNALIRAARSADATGRFAVTRPEEGMVERVFKLTRAYDLIEVHPDVDAALAAVTAGH